MSHCVKCEVSPVGEMNGQPACAEHLAQWGDFASRQAPLAPSLIHAKVKTPSFSGVSTSGTPRHYK
jgi:hypothetical protein